MESPLPPDFCAGQLTAGGEPVNRDRCHIEVRCELLNIPYLISSLVISQSLTYNANIQHYMTTVPSLRFTPKAFLAMSGDSPLRIYHDRCGRHPHLEAIPIGYPHAIL